MDPNVIASKAIEQFNKLHRKGKPNPTEWTTMSAIIQEQNGNLKVVAIGTGTKCLGKSELSAKGDVVSDSHAEVVARRSFMLYLYEQVELCKIGKCAKSVLEFKDKDNDINVIDNLKLKKGVRFHMFVSHLPCGDAAIIDKVSEKDKDSEEKDCNESISSSSSPPPSKKFKCDEGDDNDSQQKQEHRTGAKLQVGPLQYEETQMTGKCRVKPGKGDPTLCMSCSDKLAKWHVLGLQGCLLSIFIVEPIRLQSITIGGENVSFNKEALERAVFTRFADGVAKILESLDSLPLEGYQCPEVDQSGENFMKLVETLNPAPASISWYPSLSVLDPNKEAIQVLVGGRKQGATKKFFGKMSSMVDICRAKIFTRFKSLYFSKEDNLTYKECKAMSKTYNETWLKLKQNVFVGWTEKPEEFQQFT